MMNATAPYNFVSLPEKILPVEFDGAENYCRHVSEHGNLSGEIKLNIKTLTPLFIGGNGSESFAPVNTPIIPGSSLRGMFKNIFKIVMCGTFRGYSPEQKKGEDFNDEHIYFRCLMKNGKAKRDNGYNWSKGMSDYYKDLMTSDNKKKARPGFLIEKVDGTFYIAPANTMSGKKIT